MLLLTFLFVFCLQPANGQGDCISLNAACNSGSFRVQIMADPEYTNTSGCPSAPACSEGDQFRQLFYKVRLIYIPSDPNENLDFALDYSDLTIMYQSIVTNPVAEEGYSFIDTKVTNACFEETATTNGWSGIDFITSEDGVYIHFEDLVANSCPSNVIQFAENTGACIGSVTKCAVADLFRIAVNAYPGEEVKLQCEQSLYDAPSEGDCTLICSDTEQTALLPSVGSSEPLEVRLNAPVDLNDGGCSVEVEVVNHGTSAAAIDYLEFVVKIEAAQVMTPEVVSNYDRPALIDNTTRYIHFIVPDEGWTLTANGGTHSIGVINITPPQLSNITWNATISLVDSDKSRVKTPTYCHNLPLSDLSQVCEIKGNSPCTYDNGGVVFTIEGVTPDECEDPFTKKINIGFRDTETGTTDVLNLKALEFSLEIKVAGDVDFAEVNALNGWPTGICPTISTCSPCYESTASGNIINFSYCIIIPDGTTGYLSISPAPTAFLELVFEEPGCIESVTLTSLSLRRHGDTEVCIPMYEDSPYEGIPICPPHIFGTIATELGHGVEGVNIGLVYIPNTGLAPPAVQPSGCNITACPKEWFMNPLGTGASGAYGFCPCEECRYFDLIPKKNDNPHNGLTTYDLVLISRHILGIEPLDPSHGGSSYRMIAADANKSGSITTFDVVEFRKLILGIYDTIPGNTSWRFVDKAFVFPNPDNPFQTAFPEDNMQPIDIVAKSANEVDFVAIKVGDVNNTVVANRPTNRPEITLSWPELRAKKGGVLTVPFIYSGAESLEAIQLGLRYDPEVLQLISPSQGELSAWGPDNFNLANSGEVRTLWLPADPSDPDQVLSQGKVLFYLTFKVLTAIPESGLPIWLDNMVLDNAAWRPDGTECALVHSPPAISERNAMTEAGLLANCRPNPSSGDLTFSINAANVGKGRIALYSPFGIRVLARDVVFTTGEQEISLPEAIQLPAGVYVWKVIAKAAKVQGHWVKQ